MFRIKVFREQFELGQAFRISRGAKKEAKVIRVQVELNGVSGQGECVPYQRYNETLDSVEEQVARLELPEQPESARNLLGSCLPPGAARNALDCALWDLQAKMTGKPAWELTGLGQPMPVETAFTLSLDTPEVMNRQAEVHSSRKLLKIKLGGPQDRDCLLAVHAGAPESTIIVDANEGWSVEDYEALADVLAECNVGLLEQPFPAEKDDALSRLSRPVPVCADESCHTTADLAGLRSKYDCVNIKLDKSGGLTEAIRLKNKASREGFKIMVGCMVGTSLGMAPALLLTKDACYVDLDGPLLLKEDRVHGLVYEGSTVTGYNPELWG